MYNHSQRNRRLFLDFKAAAASRDDLGKPDTLCVVIADECHYAPTKGGAHDKFVNDADLCNAENVVTLLVSATPYNCLTKDTRIMRSNVQKWFEEGEQGSSTYVGLDFYLDTITFRVPKDESSFFWPGSAEQGRLWIEERRYTSFADVCRRIKIQLVASSAARQSGAAADVNCVGAGCVQVKNAGPLPVTFRLGGVLKKLGFRNAVPVVPGGGAQVGGGGGDCGASRGGLCWGGRALEQQHIRSDESFAALHDKFLQHFGKRKGKTLSVDMRVAEGVPLHPGHLIMADYLFSMAYFAALRIRRDYTGPGEPLFKRLPPGLADGSAADAEAAALEAVSKQRVKRFRGMLLRAACFVHRGIEYNFKPGGGAAGASGRDGGGGASQVFWLAKFLREKLKAEAHARQTSDEFSWFTETDRVVRDLLGVNKKRGWGKMVVIRVYENDESLSMQHCFRHAAKVFGFVHAPEGLPKKEQPHVFSVLSDVGETNIAQHLEPWFYSFKLDDTIAAVAKDAVRPAAAAAAAAAAAQEAPLTYSDLHRMPILIILCEKGRMGDTFPPSLAYLDLRLRTAGKFTSFKQELGRLSRYPVFKNIGSLVWPLPSGRAEDALNYRRAIVVATALLEEGATAYCGRARTVWELEGHMDAACARYGSNGRLLPTVFRLKESVDGLPTALINTETMEKLRKAVVCCEDERAAALANGGGSGGGGGGGSGSGSDADISGHIRMQCGLDAYMDLPKRRGPPIGVHDYREYSASSGHYDHCRSGGGGGGERRLLLQADCQIGKTGAYLHFLSLLQEQVTSPTDTIHAVPEEPVLDPVQEPTPLSFSVECLGASPEEWLFPWRMDVVSGTLQGSYNKPSRGKYMAVVARVRLRALRECCKVETFSWAAMYAEWLRAAAGHEAPGLPPGEHIVSKTGQAKAPFDRDGSWSPADGGERTAQAALNWDGRLSLLEESGTEAEAQSPWHYTATLPALLRRIDEKISHSVQEGRYGLELGGTRQTDHGSAVQNAGGERKYAARRLPAVSTAAATVDDGGCIDHFEYSAALRCKLLISEPIPWRSRDARWIFTPSLNRAAFGKTQALLDRDHTV
ncbi:unnamed protein product [Phaeothamnion confervicola]